MSPETETVYSSLVEHPEDSLAQRGFRLELAQEKVGHALSQLTEMGLAEAPARQVRAVGFCDAVANLAAHAVLEGMFEYLGDDKAADEWLTTAYAQAQREIAIVGMLRPGRQRRTAPSSGADGARRERGLILRGITWDELLACHVAAVGRRQLGVSEADVRLIDHGQTQMAVVDRSAAFVQVGGEPNVSSLAISSPDVVAGLLAVFHAHWRQADRFVHLVEKSEPQRAAPRNGAVSLTAALMRRISRARTWG
ncbi:hypothetical protein ACFWVC_28230 [Streptomyces sp. NPDC058691]|uniref:hypothetical protein n=1 Tax=Streptomyces sp. NPDC058691 TaxID=3346601 RepID=UPI00365A1EE0